MRCTKAIFAIILAVVCLFSVPVTVAHAKPSIELSGKDGIENVVIADEDFSFSPRVFAVRIKNMSFLIRKTLIAQLSTIKLVSPLEKYGRDVEIRSWYGYRKSINGKTSTYHGGIDMGASYGNSSLGLDVCAAASGIVVLSEWTNYGNTVVIRHYVDGKFVNTLYGHMVNEQRPKASNNSASNPPLVKVGQFVHQGDVIGHIGMTYGPNGYATGPHLHFEIRIPENSEDSWGEKVNPSDYIKFQDVHVIAYDA